MLPQSILSLSCPLAQGHSGHYNMQIYKQLNYLQKYKIMKLFASEETHLKQRSGKCCRRGGLVNQILGEPFRKPGSLCEQVRSEKAFSEGCKFL